MCMWLQPLLHELQQPLPKCSYSLYDLHVATAAIVCGCAGEEQHFSKAALNEQSARNLAPTAQVAHATCRACTVRMHRVHMHHAHATCACNVRMQRAVPCTHGACKRRQHGACMVRVRCMHGACTVRACRRCRPFTSPPRSPPRAAPRPQRAGCRLTRELYPRGDRRHPPTRRPGVLQHQYLSCRWRLPACLSVRPCMHPRTGLSVAGGLERSFQPWPSAGVAAGAHGAPSGGGYIRRGPATFRWHLLGCHPGAAEPAALCSIGCNPICTRGCNPTHQGPLGPSDAGCPSAAFAPISVRAPPEHPSHALRTPCARPAHALRTPSA